MVCILVGCASPQGIGVETRKVTKTTSSTAEWSTYSDTMNSIQFSVRYPAEWNPDYDRHAIRFGDRGIIDFAEAPMGMESDIVEENAVTLANLPFNRKAFGNKQTGRIGNIYYSLQIDSPDSPLRNVKLPFTFSMVGVQMPSNNNDQYVKLVGKVMDTLQIER